MSLVEITTRHSSSSDTYTSIIRVSPTSVASPLLDFKMFADAISQGGERLYIGLAKHGHRSSPGTTVIVRDLFFKWPVRRKQAESSSSFAVATISQIRRLLEALAIFNHNVAFQVYDLDRLDTTTVSSRIATTTTSSSMSDCIASLYGKHLVKVCSAYLSRSRTFIDTLFN